MLDHLADWVVNTLWRRKFLGKGGEIDRQQLTRILNQAHNSLMRQVSLLEEMGLRPQIQTVDQLWATLSKRFGGKKLSLPHLLILDEKGLREELTDQVSSTSSQYTKTVTSSIGEEIHAASKLLHSGVPFADRSFVRIHTPKGKAKYIAVLVLEDKPGGYLGDKGQLLNFWSLFAREAIHDIEIITELSPADANSVRLIQQLLTRNALSREVLAQERGTIEVAAQINTESSVDAQRRLYTGDVPLNTSVVILVYRDSQRELDEACRYLSGLVKQPAHLGREVNYAWLIWLQTLGLRREALLSAPYYRRLQFFASEVSGVCNLVQVAAGDRQGFELLAHEGGTPVFIDFSKPKNVLVLGTTGSGKSVLVASILAKCLALGMPVITIDLPNSDGTGTFGDFTPFFNGIYFDISKESNNLVQPLDVSKITSQEEQKRRIQEHTSDVILIITRLILATDRLEGFLVETIESLIPLGVNAFYQDPEIQARFEAARREGLGSKAWNNTPTIADLKEFYSSKYIKLAKKDANTEQALNFICLRLEFWLASSLNQAIGKPSTFDIDHSQSTLITFALTNLQSEKEAEILGLSAYAAARRQSLSSLNSVFFMDEASVLLGYLSLSLLIGRLCATARKSGCRIILAAQDVDSIAESAKGAQILQNMPCRLIGRILPGAAQSYEDYLGIPQEIVSQNEMFQANFKEVYTRWLLDYQNTYTHCRFYPSYPMLALTANNREEQAMRDKFKAQYPNKFEWLTEFYRYYKKYIRQGEIK